MMMRTAKTILLVLCAAVAASCTKTEVLKIYNWVDYMDSSVVAGFETEYYKTTGRRVKVDIQLFENGEEAMQVLRNNQTSYDLVCPTGYMVESLLQDNLLQPIGNNLVPLSIFEPWTLNLDFDPENTYCLPYMYGTMGIMYDMSKPGINREDMKSWAALWNPDYRNEIVLKSDPFELYCTAVLYVRRQRLLEKTQDYTYPPSFQYALVDAIYDFSEDMVSNVLSALNEQKKLVMYYSMDRGRIAMERGVGGKLGLFWSCEAVLSMAVNRSIEYSLPLEGSYCYVDYWVIPKSAQNVEAARAFLKYIYRTENAERNMLASGAPSAVSKAASSCKQRLLADNGFFSNVSPEWKAMYIETFFPSDSSLKRCWLQKPYVQYLHTVNQKLESFVEVADKEAEEHQKYLEQVRQY
jgi:spermidine/putrescine transport system substrate-binding protein